MSTEKDQKMYDLLDRVLKLLPDLLTDKDRWKTLVINRRKPHTYRAYTMLDEGVRVCLHRFEPCEPQDAFHHAHPWPGAFWVAEGSYRMIVGKAADEFSEFEHCLTLDLAEGSSYAMTDELTSHSVQPLETCYSVMVNLQPYDLPHKQAPTTKGKDLKEMTSDDLEKHLNKFKRFAAGV